jgi:putative transcriptional regulator
MNRIKELLEKHGKSERWIADILNVDVRRVSSWCENNTQPSLNTLFVIAKLLKVEAGEIYISQLSPEGMKLRTLNQQRRAN